MTCPTCGYVLEPFDKECPRCKRFAEAQAQQAAQPTAQPWTPPAPAQQSPYYEPDPAPSWTWPAWGWPVLGVLAALAWYLAPSVLPGLVSGGDLARLKELNGQTVTWEAEITSFRSQGIDEWGIETAAVTYRIVSGPAAGVDLSTQGPAPHLSFGLLGVGQRGTVTGPLSVTDRGGGEIWVEMNPATFVPAP